MQEHPSKLILGWMGHLVAPEWDDRKAYNNCYHCSQRFQIGHQHHCRLCGHMFCSMCTAKYLVSSQFKRKDKDGPDRVCFGCRNQCLERRAKFVKNEPALKPQMVLAYDNAGIMHIYPPVWAKAGSYMNCKLCHEMLVKGNTHHCRACGEMFDKNCTTKMEVPQAFKKKPKNGPCRVCYECRYHLLSGKAVLDERPISALNSNVSLLNTESLPAAKLLPVSILWEDTNEKPIVTLNVVGQCTLEEINDRLLRAMPDMKPVEYTYICRGRPIFKEHWGVFNADFISPEIIIRQGTLEVVSDDQPDLKTIMTAPANINQQNHISPRMQSKMVALHSSFEPDKSTKKQPENFHGGKRASEIIKSTTILKPVKPLNIEHNKDAYGNFIERSTQANINRPNVNILKQEHMDKLEEKPLDRLQEPFSEKLDLSNQEAAEMKSPISDAKPLKADEKQSDNEMAQVNGDYLLVRSRYDFKTDKATLLSCSVDENLIIIKRPEKSGWWLAQNASKQKGWVPARYMQILHEYSNQQATSTTTKAIEYNYD